MSNSDSQKPDVLSEYDLKDKSYAYPFVVKHPDGTGVFSTGLSTKEHYAGLAMTALINGYVSHFGNTRQITPEAVADYAKRVASAMCDEEAK